MTWDMKAGLMGKPERDAAAHLLSFFPDIPPEFTIDEYIRRRRIGQDAFWPFVQPLPGALRLVKHLYQHKIPIAVATSSQRRNYELKSQHLMETLFGHFGGRVVCADDGLIKAGRGKPHPDIFLVTARTCLERDVGEGEIGEYVVTETQLAERARGLIFEDAIPGVQAGKNAGMQVVWVPDPNLLEVGDNENTILQKPDQILKSLEDFNPEEWGLPPYDDES
ncbi:unnamed protein product [Somion occarium]